MGMSQDLFEEIKILNLFNLESTQAGIKVHKDADIAAVAAAERLFNKGLVTRTDGGYLTGLGHDAAEHAQNLKIILTSG
jgi:uncharacterized protein (TIGR02647 family)